MHPKTLLKNGKIITPNQILEHGFILVENGKITAVVAGNPEISDVEIIDVKGQYISPGFIDIHLHGGGGFDFMDGTVEAFLGIAETHARYGTTAMLPTTLTCEKEDLIQTLEAYQAADKINNKGAQFIGMHLEGPYFAMSQRGAQDPKFIKNPDPKEYNEIIANYPFIKRWSAAPELPGAIEFGKTLVKNGILAAIAHTDAIYEEALEAWENGYSLATHFYSAMSGVSRRNAYRYAGVVEAAYLIDDMDVEIIADGVHLPSPLLQLIHKIKGPAKTVLITDAMRAAAMPEGESVLGSYKNGTRVIVEDGVAKMPERTAFAGSVATFDRLIRTMLTMGKVSLQEAIQMASLTPARIMKMDDRKGSIAVGRDADLVVFDEGIDVKLTMVGGRIVFQGK
ncbi:N-acetylglucosamine-6-phosphate deacetylase [Jiulongibacter sediminis]|uniref:N-acetylglucosamine-6-phosphate deacetylase n=1 Tax=Jiulongibacter sediminis TaxID=1605367 RepID=A0A0P7BNB4_9BACT|nr:N-acetylglucosamine-6-phosphate deacetylase [Jiulongibacter sediminis]KPM48736.1 N-acetylglucosamine-6-phosphate deacetylase [Jiulongibacter sediminis]TBX25270.1 N-acetylglucosamine-6-phosphate deacetylase [Jiulongibacter sediminis]